MGDTRRSDRAAAASDVLDDDRLTQALAQLLCYRATNKVSGTARRKGHNLFDGLAGPGLRQARHRDAAQKGKDDGNEAECPCRGGKTGFALPPPQMIDDRYRESNIVVHAILQYCGSHEDTCLHSG